jgi:predicted dehydrogenase
MRETLPPRAVSKIRTAVVGCGSVSGPYLQDLAQSPFVQLVAVCDIQPERAERRAAEFAIPRRFGHIDALLDDVEFDFLINLTSMQSHFELNFRALEAGKHVLSEKPIAGSLEEGRRLLDTATANGVRFYGAPIVVASPAFRHLAEVVASGRIGRVYQATARYGHGGPEWGPWFYQKGGGALFDLGVYNVTFLTGLLGPARAVVALSGTAIKERFVEGEHVTVEADDNTLLLLDHGDTVFSSVQTGFIYGPHREERTIECFGTRGSANLLGWDWQPKGVEVWSAEQERWQVECEDQAGYNWQRGGTLVAECLATGKPTLLTPEHAFHVLEVMLAAHKSAATGQRIEIASRFPWPLIENLVTTETAEFAPRGLDPVNHPR